MKYLVLSIKYKKVFILVVLLYTIYSILNTPSATASGLSLGITPPILQIDATPPASIQAPITIQNFEDQPIELQIVFRQFTQSEKEDGTIAYIPSSEGVQGEDPFIFEKMEILENGHVVESVNLAPGQQKTLQLHIGIEKDNPASDYYFSVIFISKNTDSQDSNVTSTAGGVATNVILSIGPKGKAKGVIDEFSTSFFHEKGPVPFTVRIRNTGRQIIVPQGKILIKNMFGQLVGKVDLLPVNILRNTVRALPDSLQSPDATPSALPNYQLPNTNSQTPQAYWPEVFLLGPYSATLSIALSDDGPFFIQTVHFIGFPMQALLGIIVVIVLILIIRTRLKRRLR